MHPSAPTALGCAVGTGLAADEDRGWVDVAMVDVAGVDVAAVDVAMVDVAPESWPRVAPDRSGAQPARSEQSRAMVPNQCARGRQSCIKPLVAQVLDLYQAGSGRRPRRARSRRGREAPAASYRHPFAASTRAAKAGWYA